jgi:hypothetical protein
MNEDNSEESCLILLLRQTCPVGNISALYAATRLCQIAGDISTEYLRNFLTFISLPHRRYLALNAMQFSEHNHNYANLMFNVLVLGGGGGVPFDFRDYLIKVSVFPKLTASDPQRTSA